MAKMTGLSRAQARRWIGRYLEQGTVSETRYRRHRFTQRYTRADVELLAAVDEAHETLSGPATRHILGREYNEFGQAEYERLATISVAQIYRLRKRAAYRQRGCISPRPIQRKWRLENDDGPSPMAAPVICGWTQCIRGIATA